MRGVDKALLSPSAAAFRLQLPTSTLRLYSVRFRTLLSSAAQPGKMAGGRPGRRRYTNDDVAVLARALDLVRSGRSFNEAVLEMGGTLVAEEESPAPVARIPAVLPSIAADQTLSTTDQAELAPIQVLNVATDGWRALARQKDEEIDRLRQRIESLEWEIRDTRRPWWKRLFLR